MGLLAPLFALGALLAAVPFFLHRLNTATPDQHEFASAMLLSPTQKREHVRKQLRYLILMTLRILLLLAIAFVFARPFMDEESLMVFSDGSVNHLVLIDTSASMSGAGKLELAKQEAKEIIRSMGLGDRAQLMVADKQLRIVAGPSNETSLLLAAIDGVEATNFQLDYGIMMSGLNNALSDDWLNHKIHLLSDLQQSGMPRQFAKLIPELPAIADVQLALYPTRSESFANWLVEYVDADGEQVRVGVKGYQSSQQPRLVELVVNGESVAEQSIDLMPSGRAVAIFEGVQFQPGINRVRASLTESDALDSDNHFHFAVDRSPPEPVPLITTNPYARPVTYLSTALETVGAPGNSQTTSNWIVQAVTFEDFDARTLERYSWVLIDDIGAIPESIANELAQFVQAGGAVFAAAGERALGLAQLPLSGHALASDVDVLGDRQASFSSVSRVESSHPIFENLKGWADLTISRSLPIEVKESDRVLAWLSNGQPFLLEQRVGRGRLVLLTTSLDNEWNNLPVKPFFVALIGQTANYLSRREAVTMQKMAGDYLRADEIGGRGSEGGQFNQDNSGAAGQIVDPNGVTLVALQNTSSLSQRQLNDVGFYELHTAGGESLIGVNIAPAESDTTPLDADDLTQWTSAVSGQVGVDETIEAAGLRAREGEDEDSFIEIWHILAIMALILLCAESLLSNFYLRRSELRA